MAQFNLHGTIPRSLVNGPGERFVIHVQGCRILCPGCINPDALIHEPRLTSTVDELFDKIIATDGIEGISISGGEPTEQLETCLALCRRIREETKLTITLYSGHKMEAIEKMPSGKELISLLDILIDGPYIDSLKSENGITGSKNQRVLILSNRYSLEDIQSAGDFEVHIHPDGHLVLTGVGIEPQFPNNHSVAKLLI